MERPRGRTHGSHVRSRASSDRAIDLLAARETRVLAGERCARLACPGVWREPARTGAARWFEGLSASRKTAPWRIGGTERCILSGRAFRRADGACGSSCFGRSRRSASSSSAPSICSGPRSTRTVFLATMQKCILAGDVAKAVKMCSAANAPLARIVQAGLVKVNRPDEEVQAAMDEAALRELPKPQRADRVPRAPREPLDALGPPRHGDGPHQVLRRGRR
jgi:hypothetical protein